MTVKARLTLAVVALLVAATAVLGWVVVSQTTASMTERVDERLGQQLAASVDGGPGAPLEDDGVGYPAPGDERRGKLGGGSDGVPTLGFVYEAARGWEPVVPQVADLLDSPPDLPDPGSAALDQLLDEPSDVAAETGGTPYRALAAELGGDRYLAIVSPTGDIEQTASGLLRTVLVTGLVVVLLGGAACWWAIRRALRPVDRMIDTASAIAGGDLSQRVELRDDRSELGRLSRALDDMLTQLEADAAERERAQSRLRQFVADASHELRTPVAAVRGYAELYRAGGITSGEPLDRAMGRIESESSRMGRLVEDLLLLTRLDQQQPLHTEPVDLGEVVRAAADAFAVIAPERPLRVSVPPGCIVAGDEVRLRQVVDNLVANAYTHTPVDAPVSVTVARTPSGRVRLEVADEGPGIPVEEQARVFERFHRLDASRSRRTGGAGLGLSIVAAIAGAHGGAVSLRSAPGEGSTFAVELPAAAATPVPAEPETVATVHA